MSLSWDDEDYFESDEALRAALDRLRRRYEYAAQNDRLHAQYKKRNSDLEFELRYSGQLNDATRYLEETDAFIAKGEFGAAEDRLEMRGIPEVIIAPIRERIRDLRRELYSRLFRALLEDNRFGDIIRLDERLKRERLHTHRTYFALAVAYQETYKFLAASQAISEAIMAKTGQPVYLIRAAHIALNCVWEHGAQMEKQQNDREPNKVLDATRAKIRETQNSVVDNLAGAWKLASGDRGLVAQMDAIYDQLLQTNVFHQFDSSPLKQLGFFDRRSLPKFGPGARR
jgi:hypothetical protein